MLQMVGGQRYRGHDIAPCNLTSYLASSQLRGHEVRVPRRLEDRIVLGSVLCSTDDEYPAIGPDLSAPASTINPEPPTYCLRFCPVPGYHHLLGLANEDGRVAIQDTSRVLPKIPLTGHPCHDNAIFDIAWSPKNVKNMVTVSGDMKVRLWDLSTSDLETMTQVREFGGHSRSVKCVEWRPGSESQFCTGARDNSIMLWDIRDRSDTSPDNVIRGAHGFCGGGVTKRRRETESLSAGVVTSLAWVDENILASAGDKDGAVKLWDLRKNYSLYRGEPVPVTEFLHPGDSSTVGYTSLASLPGSRQVFASCMDDKIYRYNTLGTDCDRTPVAVYTGSRVTNFFIKMSVSPCGRYMAGGSADNWAHIWSLDSPGAPIARSDIVTRFCLSLWLREISLNYVIDQ